MRNLAQIGYEVSSLEDFQSLADQVFKSGKAYRAGRNQYICYRDSSGAELWVQHDEEEEIAGMNAHFDSQHWISAQLMHAQAYEDRPLDGTIEAQALDVDFSAENGNAAPIFIFDLPDAHSIPKVSLPAKAKVQLVAFAREIHCFENIEDYRKANPGKPLRGLRVIEEDRSNPSRISSLMRMDGSIVDAKLLHNEKGKHDFYWMLVLTSIGEVEVVAATRALPFLPQSGQIFDGDVRLSGRVVLENAEKLKPGIMERLFWGAATNQRR